MAFLMGKVGGGVFWTVGFSGDGRSFSMNKGGGWCFSKRWRSFSGDGWAFSMGKGGGWCFRTSGEAFQMVGGLFRWIKVVGGFFKQG